MGPIILIFAATAALFTASQEPCDTTTAPLQGLTYANPARSARISGTVRATFRIDSLGHAAELQFSLGHPLLIPPVEQAIRKTAFPRVCSNQTLQVEVVFQLESSPDIQSPVPDRIERSADGRYQVYGAVSSKFDCPHPPLKPRRGWFRFKRT